jgi:predicted 3-demethylubiquinone-9 3-methyltransferase (glyoxalase superfamily)
MDGPGVHDFTFNEAVSFVVSCDTQDEIDYHWQKLTADGGQESQCGWLKDKFGVSWQVVPSILGRLMSDPEKGQRVVQAFLKMKKFNIQALLEA